MTSLRNFSIALLVVAALAGMLAAPAQAQPTPSCNFGTSSFPAQMTLGASYTLSCEASGGAGGNTWTYSGTIPTGMLTNTFSGGEEFNITGTASALGSYTFTVAVTDMNNSSGSTASFTATVSNAGSGGTPSGSVTLTSVSPNSGLTAGQSTSLTLLGTNFTPSSYVHFNGSVISPTYVNSTELIVIVSSSLVATGTLPVYVQDPTNGISGTLYVTVNGSSSGGPLSLSSISPNCASVGSTALTLTVFGSGFSQGQLMAFGTLGTLGTTFINSGEVQATIPSQFLTTAQTINVSISGSNTEQFTIGSCSSTGIISVSSVSPTTLTSEVTTTIEVFGSNFTPSSQVYFSGTPVSTTYESSSELLASIPGSLITSGSLGLYVHDPSTGTSNTFLVPVGGSGSSGIITLGSVSPNTLTPSSASTTFYAFGTNFTPSSIIHFNNTALSTNYVGSTELYTIVPSSLISAGAIPVYVTDPTNGTSGIQYVTGTGSGSSGSLSLSSLSPSSIQAGTPTFVLTLFGSGFTSGNLVTFGPYTLSGTVLSSGEIQVTIPSTYIATAQTINVSVAGSNVVQFSVTGSSTGSLGISCSPSAGPVTLGVYYSQTCSVTGGSSPYTWTVSGLPPGLSGPNTGTTSLTISGTPTTAGPYSYAVQVTANGLTGSLSVAGTVGSSSSSGYNITSLSPTSIPAGSTATTLNVYGNGFTAASQVYFNGTPVGTTFVSSAQLSAVIPASLLSAAETVSVSVYTSGANTNLLSVTVGSGGSTSSGNLTVTCSPGVGPQTVSTTFSTICSASGGTPPYNWPTPAGLPSYLALSASTGSPITISGTPVSPLPYNYTVKVTDSSSPALVSTLQIAGQVNPTSSVTGSLTITGLSPSSAAVNSPAVSMTVTGNGFVNGSEVIFNGFPIVTTFLSGSELVATIPAGLLTFASAATVTVTTPNVGTSNGLTFTVGAASAVTISITCNPGVGPATPNSYYAATCTVNGGAAPYNWSVVSGAIPTGLTFSPNGIYSTIGGYNTLNGPYNYTLQVTDSSFPQNLATATFAGTTGAGASSTGGLSISSLSPTSIAPVSASTTITINGGGFTAASVAFFNSTALSTTFINSSQLTAVVPSYLLATPTAASITVQSAGLVSNSLTLTVGTVAPTGITISCNPSAGPPGAGDLYNSTCTATGGTAPFKWLVVNGFLPSGITQSASTSNVVTFTGTTFFTGSYAYTLQVTDSSTPPQTASYQFAGTLPTGEGGVFGGTLTSLSPTTAAVGAAQFNLTVTGTGFTNGASFVLWGGTPLQTTYLSSTQLTAIVPSYLLTTIGTDNITVQTSSASGTGSTNAVGFFVTGAGAVQVAPTALTFTYALGGTFPTSQSVSITSSAAITGYSVTSNGIANNINWLTASPTSGSIPGAISVIVAPSGLAIGTYTGTVTITGFGTGTGIVIPVTLNIQGSVNLVDTPNTLSFNSSGTTSQTVKVTSSDGNSVIPYKVSAVANNGGSWLAVTPNTGTTPGSFTVTATAGSLPSATYSGAISVTPTGALGSAQSIPVTFVVTAPTTISASPASLSFSAVSGQSSPAAQTVSVSSNANNTAYSVAATTASGGNWLTATASNSTAPGTISVSASIGSLAAGAYTGTVTITAPGASNSPVTVPVTFTVAPPPATLSVSPATLTFSATTGGPAPATQTVAVSTTNSTTANYTVTASSSGNWLSATASGTTPGTVTVTVNQGTLAAGQYTGSLSIASPGATNTQTVAVTLNVTTPATIIAAPQSLSFFVPGDGSTPAPQTISVISGGGNTNFTASAFSQGGNWLNVTASGATPGSVTVSVNPTGLSAGQSYNGSVTISAPAANPSSVQVAVTLTVATQGAVPLQAAPSALYLSYNQGAGTDLQHILVLNPGGGSVNYTVQGGPNGNSNCGNWLNVLTPAGFATASAPGVVAFTVNPAGLNAQTCPGTIAINNANGGQVAVPVFMTISSGTQSELLSQTAMSFVAASGGSAPAPQTFQILNPGSGSLPWSISTSTLSGGSWLTANPNSGNAQSLGQPGSPINVTVNPTGLAGGVYYGTVQVAASGAVNSPQSITVSLTVLPSGGNPPAVVVPDGIIFTGVNGSASSQTVNVTNPGTASLSYTAILTTDDGQNWLTASPTSGTIAAGATNAVTLSPAVSSLGTGLRHGTLRLAFSNGTVQTVDVQLAIAGAASGGTAVRACASSNLTLEFLSPQQNFQATAQVPVPIQVLVQDCNGNQLTSSNTGVDVLVGASNTDIRLNYSGNGIWSGVWNPVTASSASTVTAEAYEVVGSSLASGVITANGTIGSAAAGGPPLISSVVNAGSFMFPGLIAPGAMVSIFGENLADGQSGVFSTPFPNSLEGAQFSVAGMKLPIFYASSGQVNAVMPIGLTADVRDQLIVVRDTTQSAPVDVFVADQTPGVFTVNSQGTGQAAALVGGTAQIAAPVGSIPGANTGPATAGQTVSFFIAGFGTVSNPPADGSPSTGTSLTTATPTVMIGGVPAQVAYSGLAPGEVGLYQLNVVIPAGAMTGPAVPVQVTIGNQTANFVTIALM